MKKLLPIIMFVLLAFAGCQREPATYQMANSPREVATNAEKFAKQVEKRSKHYSAEDWRVTLEQFTAMSKDYVENWKVMTDDEIMRFDNARLQFIKAVYTNGSEDMAGEVKKIYGELVR